MKVLWQEDTASRPDPYLEFEARTRPALMESNSELATTLPDDPWCSLYIRLTPPASGSDTRSAQLASLTGLAEAVRNGRLAEDPAEIAVSIRMADDEYAHLKSLIDALRKGDVWQQKGKEKEPLDRVLLQFFVYRLESQIYREGKHVRTALYEVILAGPPIPGLSFAAGVIDEKDVHPTDIDKPPGTDARGVAIGIIDDGIAFAHERFGNNSGESRVMAIWLQDIARAETTIDTKGRADQGITFGRRLGSKQINALLAKHKSDADIYREVGATDFGKNTYNPLARRATHGTHVLDLAAGSDPKLSSEILRPILAVQLPSVATLDTSGVTMGSYVLQAVRQIMLWAEKLGPDVPLVINFSFGFSAGPKDGTHPLELALNELISYRNKRASTCLVLPAGNNYRTRTTAKMTLARGEPLTLDWVILPDDPTPNFLEIWLDGPPDPETLSPIEVTLTPPEGLPSNAIRLPDGTVSKLMLDEDGDRKQRAADDEIGNTIASIAYDIVVSWPKPDLMQKRSRIFVAVNQTATKEGRVDCAPAGRWQLTLVNATTQDDVKAHLYIQRDTTPFGYRRPGRQSFFDHPDAYERDNDTGNYDGLAECCPITHNETLSALATLPVGKNAKLPPDIDGRIFVVGAVEASERFVPARYSSIGPSSTGERKGPDCSAVAEEGRAHWGVLAAGTFSGSIVQLNGTSVAAPQLVRLIANRFESERVAGTLPDAVDVTRADVNERAPNETPIGVPDQDAFPAEAQDAASLGSFIIQRRPNRNAPGRRYRTHPRPDPNPEMTN
jgi:Subtilase family